MDNVEELSACQQFSLHRAARIVLPDLHDSSTVVGDGLLAVGVDHQQVAAIGSEGRLDGGLDSQACVDVGDNLTLALRGIGSCARDSSIVARGRARGGGVNSPSFRTIMVGVWPPNDILVDYLCDDEYKAKGSVSLGLARFVCRRGEAEVRLFVAQEASGAPKKLLQPFVMPAGHGPVCVVALPDMAIM